MVQAALSPVLQRLYDATVARIAREKEEEPERELLRQATFARTPLQFHPAWWGGWPAIIAEFKRASPSEGDINLEADPVKVARRYLWNGAGAISVLTEPSEFKGDKEFLRRIRQQLPNARLLMKDFIIDWYQLLQARVYGADAVLLIVDFIDRDLLKELYIQAGWLGLTPLVEVHNPEQFDFALKLGAKLIGVNNRDLRTMKVSLEISEQVGEIVKRLWKKRSRVTVITESGIRSGEDIVRLSLEEYRAFLVGTILMKSKFPGRALSKLMKEAVREVDRRG